MNFLITTFNHTAEGFCRHALWMFVQVSILVGILWGLDWLLRKHVRASVRYCVWLLVLLKLVLPADLRLPTGAGYWLNYEQSLAEITLVTQPVALPEISTQIANSPAAAGSITEIAAVDAPESIQELKPVKLDRPVLTAEGWIFLIWILGIAGLMTIMGIQFVRIGHLVRRSRNVALPANLLYEQYKETLGLGHVQVRQSDEVSSPAVCGLLRPVILIPNGLVGKLTAEQLEFVLLHELMHIKRYDLWINLFQNVLQIFYFYNPFVRLANNRIRKTREQANDEQVLVHLNGRRDHYSAALIEVAAASLGRPRLALRLIGVAEPKSHLHERITLMMQKPIPTTTKLGLWTTVSLALLALVLLPMAGRVNAAVDAIEKVPALTPEQFVAQSKEIISRFIEGNNSGNVSTAVSIYTQDGIQLSPNWKAAIGKVALTELLMKDINDGVRILSANGVFTDVWFSGRFGFAIQRSTAAVRVPGMNYLQLIPMKSLDVMEIQPDGTLKVQVNAWNLDQHPATATLAEGVGLTEEKNAFHVDQSNSKAADASPETLDKIKQLSKEFHQKCIDGDAAAISSYYADNAIYLASGAADTMRGRQQIQDTTAPFRLQYRVESIGDEILAIKGTEEMVYVVNSFLWKLKDLAKGDQLITIPGKGVHVWQKQADGTWKILVDLNHPNPQ